MQICAFKTPFIGSVGIKIWENFGNKKVTKVFGVFTSVELSSFVTHVTLYW